MTARRAAAHGALRRRALIAYALPGFVFALPTIPVFIHLPALYGVNLGLGLAATGMVLLLARLFDTVTDPIAGVLCDRLAFRGMRRKPWIAVGAVIAGVGLVKILNPPASADEVYLLIWSVVLYGGWTMVTVPYLAWGAELSADYDERTRITAWREGLSLIGMLAAGGLTAAVTAAGGTETQSIGAIAWIAIACGIVFVPLLLSAVPEPPLGAAPRDPLGIRVTRSAILSLWGNKPFLRLILAWFLNGLANGIPAALFFVYLEFALGAGEAQRPYFLLVYFVSAVAAIPLWRTVSRRIGKHRAWCLAMSAACLAFVAVPFVPAGGFVAFAAVCVITGMALGADLVLPPSMQADVVDYGAWRSGRAQTGLLFALWGMSTKLALAAAVGMALSGVSAFGFDPADATASGRTALIVIYSLVPVVIKLVAIATVWRFPLTAERQAAIRGRLSRRRSETLKSEGPIQDATTRRRPDHGTRNDRMFQYETD